MGAVNAGKSDITHGFYWHPCLLFAGNKAVNVFLCIPGTHIRAWIQAQRL